MRFRVPLSENKEMTLLRKALAHASKVVEAPKRALTALGRHMAFASVPKNFHEGGRPKKWRRLKHRAGQALLDTGRLLRSIGFEVRGTQLYLTAGGGTHNILYARLQQEGGTIVPVRAKWLMLPLSPPLSITEARTRRPRDFHGAFWIFGPEGPGLYRKTRGYSTSRKTKQGGFARSSRVKTIERIFMALKKVVVPPRPYLVFQQDDLEYGAYLLFASAFPDIVGGAPKPLLAGGAVLGFKYE